MFDRKEFMNEIILRKELRKTIHESLSQKKEMKLQEKLKENMIRKSVRQMLLEKGDDVYYKNTGINILAMTMKKIIPIIRRDFKTLTTSSEQRRSFRAHIINAFRNAILPVHMMAAGDTQSVPGTDDFADGIDGDLPVSPEALSEEEGLEIELPPEEQDEPQQKTQFDKKILDVDPEDEKQRKAQEKDQKKKIGNVQTTDQELQDFTVEGEDMTGRNLALQTFSRIEKIIIDGYSLLENQEDRRMFYDFGIANLKHYFDRFEVELKDK
jgi:hypothetical protein